MSSLVWSVVAPEFYQNGSWRDVYVLNTDIDAWQHMLDGLRATSYDLVYRRGEQVIELPQSAVDAFPAEGKIDRLLWVRFAGVLAACHFFTPDEIEFDIDPREVQGQEQLDAVLTFMRRVAGFTGRDVILTPENCREIVVFRARPGQFAVEHTAFGGWR